MNAEILLRNDLPEIIKFDAKKVIEIARRKAQIDLEVLMSSGEWERMNPNQEVIFLSAFNALADEAGRTRGGVPSLGDQILARQIEKVIKYGAKAYRLSNKQVAVILRDAFAWIK